MPKLARRPERPQTETDVLREVRAALATFKTDVVFWRNNTGSLQDATGRYVTYGLCEGSADLVGIVRGRFVALEVKRPGGTTSKQRREDQAAWGNIVRAAGGVYEIVTSAEEAEAVVWKLWSLL
jgi:hypothetical protein